jgi:hypothetical protein
MKLKSMTTHYVNIGSEDITGNSQIRPPQNLSEKSFTQAWSNICTNPTYK